MLKLFGGNIVTEAVEIPGGHVDVHMEGTEQELYDINLQAHSDFMAIESATFVSDAFLTQAYVSEGVERYEVLKEESKAGILESIKTAILKFWNSVKAWFAKAAETITIIFGNGKKLADKYGDEFLKLAKSVEGADYPETLTMQIHLNSGDAEFERVRSAIANELDAVSAKASSKSDLINMFSGDSEKTIEKFKESLKIGDSSVGEAVKKAYNYKSITKGKPFQDGNLKPDEMIKILKNDNAVKTLKNERNKVETQFKNAVALINKAKQVASKDDSTGFVAAAKNAAKYMQQLMSLYNQALSVKISMWKKAYGYSQRFLKIFLTIGGSDAAGVRERSKPTQAKESWDFESFIGDFSL